MNNDIFPFEENWNKKINEKRKTIKLSNPPFDVYSWNFSNNPDYWMKKYIESKRKIYKRIINKNKNEQ